MTTKSWFERKDFACKCGCGYDTVDYELMTVLNSIREHFGVPLVITSGCRCEVHNKNEGGSKKSKHMYGTAADFRPTWNNPRFHELLTEIHEYLLIKYSDKYGIAIGDTFVHIDIRPNPARWTY